MFTGCDGTTVVEQPENLDLVGADPLPMPAISVCKIEVFPRYNLELSGTTSHGSALQVALDLPPLAFDIPAGVRDRHLILELGAPGWLDLSAQTSDYAVAPGTAAHDSLLAAVISATRVYHDADGNGQISDSERQEGAEAAAIVTEDPTDTDDTDAPDTDALDTDATDTDTDAVDTDVVDTDAPPDTDTSDTDTSGP